MDFDKVGYGVVDLETSVNCPPDRSSNKALPAWPGNNVVMLGVAGEDRVITARVDKSLPNLTRGDAKLIVGQHILFDLQYIKKEWPVAYLDIVKESKIWDTAVAEYCMSAQERLYPSLNDLATKYGGSLKDDKIKAYWDSGFKTEDIPSGELEEYLKGDVENTRLVFKKQFEECATNDRQLTRLILSQGNTLLAYADMMMNGMAIDLQELELQKAETERRIAYHKGFTEGMVKLWCGIPPHLRSCVDINSPTFMSKVFFGGHIKYKDKDPDGFYKNGKPKTKVVEKLHIVSPLDRLPENYKAPNKSGFSVDDAVLKDIAASSYRTSADVAKSMLKIRGLSKDLNTYILPIMAKTFDGKLHGNINNTSTATGRSSSSDPNLQNLTSKEKSDIKKAFVSRWGKDGYVVEADYKQLEIVALAYITNCFQLKMDINNGIDVHTALFKQMYSRTPTEEERKNFKRRSFALIYGASAKSIAEQCGCSLAEAKTFMKVWADRYPETLTFRDNLLEHCKAGGVYDGHDAETKLPRESYIWTSPTGRRIKFRQYYTEWLKRMSYSPTQIANYPIQSFATADIVQTVLGVLFRKIFLNERLREKCLLINTVHDSIEFDIHKDVLEEALNLIKDTMSNVSGILNNTYNITDFDVNVVVNITKGINWFEQEPV